MRMQNITTILTVAATFVAAPWAAADAPPGPYFNGFETDTAGWFNFSGATITRVPSGSMSTYANGVAAATGSYYARLGIDPSPDSCTFGGGTAPIDYGPYTKWGGYSAIFPPGGYSTGVDIYLDVPYAMNHPDTRFDWSSAISDTSGDFRRDFVFNVGTDALGFVITGGNNATRCGANPADPGHSPIAHITMSGWYTFKHTFSGVSAFPVADRVSQEGAIEIFWMRSPVGVNNAKRLADEVGFIENHDQLGSLNDLNGVHRRAGNTHGLAVVLRIQRCAGADLAVDNRLNPCPILGLVGRLAW